MTATYTIHDYAGTNEDKTVTVGQHTTQYATVSELTHGFTTLLPHHVPSYGITILRHEDDPTADIQQSDPLY